MNDSATDREPARDERANLANPRGRPYVSVVVAVLNGAATIQRCLDSIFAQTFREWELIVVDGGSTDGTVEVLQANSDGIQYLVSEPDNGVYDAWNKAVANARGAWICFLGVDDRFHGVHVLEEMAQHLKGAEGTYRVVYGSINKVDATGRVLKTEGREWSLARSEFRERMAIPHPAVFHHRSLFERHGQFDHRYRISGDYEFLLRELLERDALFAPRLIVVDMTTGGLSERRDNFALMVRETHAARRAHGLNHQPLAISLALFRSNARVWLARRFGSAVADRVSRSYRLLTRKPTTPTPATRLEDQDDASPPG